MKAAPLPSLLPLAVIVLALALLIGCASPHQQVAQVCEGYGWGSPQCSYATSVARQQTERSHRMMMNGYWGLQRTLR